MKKEIFKLAQEIFKLGDSMQPNNREMVVVKRVWSVFGESWVLPFSKISGFFILGTNYATIPIIFCSLIFHITKSGNGN